MTAVPSGPRDDRAEEVNFRDQLAEQAWGVLVAAAESGASSWSVVARAIVENQLPLIEARAVARAQQELRVVADEIRARFGWAGGYGKALRARADALGQARRQT